MGEDVPVREQVCSLGDPSTPPDFASAHRAFLEAKPADCLELCRAAVAADAAELSRLVLLQCRALIRLYDFGGAMEMLDRHRADLRGADGLMARVLAAIILVRRGATDRGLAALQALQDEAAVVEPTIRAELALGFALAHYCRREFDRVDAALREVGPQDHGYYARAVMYRGYVAVQRNDYRGAVAIFQRALDELERAPIIDAAVEQNVLAAMSLIAVELLDDALWSKIEARARQSGLDTPGSLHAKFLFAYTRSIHAETQGSPGEALLAARKSADAASTPQERLLAVCRRATVLLRYDQRIAYGDLALSIRERFLALEPASVERWEVTAIPLAVAEILALMGDVSGAAAAAEFGMRESTPSTDEWSAPTAAYRVHVQGMLAEAKGESFRAQHCYRRAFRLYAEIGFAHRAMIVALHMEGGARDAAVLQYLELHSRGIRPDSWIARRYAALGAPRHDDVVARLSRADREVLTLLFEGRSTAEIAALRNRTVQTVRNSVSRLNHMFGVDNRQALVRECARRNMFGPD